MELPKNLQDFAQQLTLAKATGLSAAQIAERIVNTVTVEKQDA